MPPERDPLDDFADRETPRRSLIDDILVGDGLLGRYVTHKTPAEQSRQARAESARERVPARPNQHWQSAARSVAGSSRARDAIYDAAVLNPDEEAKHRKIARQLGVPQASVRSVPAEARLEAIRQDYMTPEVEDALRSAPKASAWLSRGDNAAVAHDDVGVLARIGRGLFGAFEAVNPGVGLARKVVHNARPDDYARGVTRDLTSPSFYTGSAKAMGAGLASGFAGEVETLTELEDTYSPGAWIERKVFGGTMTEGLLDLARARRRGWAELQQAVRPATHSQLGRDISSGIESTGIALGAAGVTLATGNPWAGTAVLATITGGRSYSEARDAGLDQ